MSKKLINKKYNNVECKSVEKVYRKKTKIRRGGKHVSGSKLKVLSSNSQGDKFSCLASVVKSKDISVFLVQETQTKKKGKHQLDNYVIFESKRTKVGGGSLMGVHKRLNPVLISVYENDFELIVVETNIANKTIRFITGYGPQEDVPDDVKAPFFISLDQEISNSISDNKSVYVAMDINSKLGNKYIQGDPNPMSKNGEILAELVDKNALVVANGIVEKCQGVITRQRNTEDGRCEKSVIDIVLITPDLEEDLMSIKIDEERKFVLTKIVKKRNG